MLDCGQDEEPTAPNALRDQMETTGVLLENQRWLWTVVYSRLGDRLATEDVLQEISLAAVKSSKQRQQIREVKGWLYQVAIKQVLLFRRKEARNRNKLNRLASVSPVGDDTCPTNYAPPPNSLESVARAEQTELVRNSLSQLRPSDRQVLLMKYQEDLSCRQIAEHFGVAESTIQSRLLRARRKLRTLLLKQEDFQDLKR